MALKERIANEMKAALLGGDRFVGETLRNLKAAILNEEVATGKREEGLADEEIEKVVVKEVKKRVESAKLYRDNDRLDLAEPEEQEMEILQRYLPKQITEDEITAVIEQKAKELNVATLADMGRLIGAVKSELGNTADGGTIARIVKQTLGK
ncbi:MAG: GatB/YqeY domain-containing protein [Candidatus Saccharimonas sp.]